MDPIRFPPVRRSFLKSLICWLALAGWLYFIVSPGLAPGGFSGKIHFLYLLEARQDLSDWPILAKQFLSMMLLGALFPLARGRRCLNDTLLLSGLAAFALEFLQYWNCSGLVCLDDVLLAVLAAWIGYQAFFLICRALPGGYRYLRTYDQRSAAWLLFLIFLAVVFRYGATEEGQKNLSVKLDIARSVAESAMDGGLREALESQEDPFEEEIYDALYDGFTGYRNSVSFILPWNVDSDLVGDRFEKVLRDHPELFWLSGNARIEGIGVSSRVRYTLTAEYVAGVDSPAKMDEAFLREAEQILQQAETFSTDREKALFVHDYLVQNTHYDTVTALVLKEIPTLSHTAYGCLVEKKAVCSGYAKAFQLLMNRLGIPCGYVGGTAKNDMTSGPHAWNYVCIDGQYSYVDVTWDDPVDLFGGGDHLSHEYFCISAEQMAQDHFPDADQYIPEPLRLK